MAYIALGTLIGVCFVCVVWAFIGQDNIIEAAFAKNNFKEQKARVVRDKEIMSSIYNAYVFGRKWVRFTSLSAADLDTIQKAGYRGHVERQQYTDEVKFVFDDATQEKEEEND